MNPLPREKKTEMGEEGRVIARSSVLVIDDEAALREWLLRGLPTRGYKTATAADGSEALEKIKHQRFDLIVCDIRMPGQGGMDVLQNIKRAQPDVEVIM